MSHLRSAMRILPFLAVSMVMLAPTLSAQTVPTATPARETVVSLLGAGSPLAIYNDQQTGVPSFMAGSLPQVSANVTTPAEAARAFFSEQAGLFRMRDQDAELALIRDE